MRRQLHEESVPGEGVSEADMLQSLMMKSDLILKNQVTKLQRLGLKSK